jgi:hypothetical protein
MLLCACSYNVHRHPCGCATHHPIHAQGVHTVSQLTTQWILHATLVLCTTAYIGHVYGYSDCKLASGCLCTSYCMACGHTPSCKASHQYCASNGVLHAHPPHHTPLLSPIMSTACACGKHVSALCTLSCTQCCCCRASQASKHSSTRLLLWFAFHLNVCLWVAFAVTWDLALLNWISPAWEEAAYVTCDFTAKVQNLAF